MAKIRVVTDSACDLPAAIAAENDVTVVPLSIRFGDEEFVDGTTLSTEEFWARCKSSPVLPETSAPSPGAFQAAFESAADDGCDGVLCLDLSAGVSATFQAASTAAKAVGDRIDIRVHDSRSLTMGLGLMVLELAERAGQGASLEDLSTRVEEMIPHTTVLGAVDTLEHLEKGGRIGGARALLGSLLSIKPVVVLVDGVVEEESKQRTRGRSLRYLADKVAERTAAAATRGLSRRGDRPRPFPRDARRGQDRVPTGGHRSRAGGRYAHRARHDRHLHADCMLTSV